MEIKVPEITKKNIKIAKLNPSTLVIILIVTGTFHPMTRHIRAVLKKKSFAECTLEQLRRKRN